VTIDGRVGGTTPNTKDLTITNINTGTSAATIQFIESAAGNTLNIVLSKVQKLVLQAGLFFSRQPHREAGMTGIPLIITILLAMLPADL